VRHHKMRSHRRRRRRGHLGWVLMVVASTCLIGTSNGAQAASTGTPIHLVSLTMESTTVGWGVDRHLGGQLVHTVDGGRTWINVTPPGISLGVPTYKAMQANSLPEPPDDTVTWIRSGSTAMTITERSHSIRGVGVLEFSETTDSGRHWHQWTVHLGHLADGVIGNPSLYQVDFVSANDGWLQFLPGSSSTASMTILGMELWHTTNGGRAWTRVNQISPQSGVAVSSVTFTNATTGWITESKLYHNPSLLHTTNAGHTWSHIPRMVPDGSPMFHDMAGALLVYSVNGIKVRTTTSSGRRWGPPRILPGQEPSVQILGPQVLSDRAGSTWWLSKNGGRRWTVQSHDEVLTPNTAMDVLNTSVAWVWNERGGPSTMARTTDGGRTWMSWTPTLES